MTGLVRLRHIVLFLNSQLFFFFFLKLWACAVYCHQYLKPISTAVMLPRTKNGNMNEESDDGLWQRQKGRNCLEDDFWKIERRCSLMTDIQASSLRTDQAYIQSNRDSVERGTNGPWNWKPFYHHGLGFFHP